MPSCLGLIEHRESRHGQLKSTFSCENFVRRLSWSISIDFGAIRFWNVFCSRKSPNNP